ATGGSYLATADPRALTQLYSQVQQSLQNQYQISYTSKSTADALQIDVTGAGATVSANATVGGVAQGTNAQPQIVDANGGSFGFLGGSAGKWIGVLLGLIAAGMLAYGIILIVVRERSTLESALQPYSGEHEDDEAAIPFESGPGSISDSALLQRAVAMTGRF